jgi:hypothetical protein
MPAKPTGKGPPAIGKPVKTTAATRTARQGKPPKGGKKRR